MNLQQIADRVTHLELLATDQHPDQQNYLEALAVQHMSPEDAAAWRENKRKQIDAAAIESGAAQAVANLGPMIEARANEIITLKVQEMVTAEIAKAKAAIDAAKLSGKGD
jgi:hypothetical protein